jgi:hypothetical protein
MVVTAKAAVCFTDKMFKELALEVDVPDVRKPGNVWEAVQTKIMANAGKDNQITAVGLIGYQVKQ